MGFSGSGSSSGGTGSFSKGGLNSGGGSSSRKGRCFCYFLTVVAEMTTSQRRFVQSSH